MYAALSQHRITVYFACRPIKGNFLASVPSSVYFGISDLEGN